jgi:hypothetical protein
VVRLSEVRSSATVIIKGVRLSDYRFTLYNMGIIWVCILVLVLGLFTVMVLTLWC